MKMLICAAALVFSLVVPLDALVTILMSGGFSAAVQDLLSEFEKSTGITVTGKLEHNPFDLLIGFDRITQ
jgi:hypothetical protein